MALENVHLLGGMERADGTLLLTAYALGVDLAVDPHTLLLHGRPGGSFVELANTPWLQADACASPDRASIALIARHGRFLVFAPDAHATAHLDGDETDVRWLGVVDGELYACGTDRMVHRLEDASWHAIDAGLRRGAGSVEALAGMGRQELYGFGWFGEIHRYDGDRWRPVPSPTDRTLQAAARVGDRIVAAGQGGVVVEGRGESWRAFEAHDADIWSVEAHAGVPYLSSSKGIGRLIDGRWVPTDTSDLRSTRSLFVGPSGLWSIGGGTVGLLDRDRWHTVVRAG